MSFSGRRTYSFTEISPFYEPGLANPDPLSAPPLSQTPINTANGSSTQLTQRNLRISSPRTSPYPSPPRTKTVTTTSCSHTSRSPPPKETEKQFDRMVDKDDEIQELKNEFEILKVRMAVIPLVEGVSLLMQNREGWRSWRRKMQSFRQRRLNHIQTKKALVFFCSFDRHELKYPFLGYRRPAAE